MLSWLAISLFAVSFFLLIYSMSYSFGSRRETLEWRRYKKLATSNQIIFAASILGSTSCMLSIFLYFTLTYAIVVYGAGLLWYTLIGWASRWSAHSLTAKSIQARKEWLEQQLQYNPINED